MTVWKILAEWQVFKMDELFLKMSLTKFLDSCRISTFDKVSEGIDFYDIAYSKEYYRMELGLNSSVDDFDELADVANDFEKELFHIYQQAIDRVIDFIYDCIVGIEIVIDYDGGKVEFFKMKNFTWKEIAHTVFQSLEDYLYVYHYDENTFLFQRECFKFQSYKQTIIDYLVDELQFLRIVNSYDSTNKIFDKWLTEYSK